MSKPVEIYQVQQIRDNSIEELRRMIRELNQQLFEISKQLAKKADA